MTTIPKGYKPLLNVLETERAIKSLRTLFEDELAKRLNLMRVSAPLFVKPETGLNDNLNGVERPVGFDILEQRGAVVEIVQSLAKWKRYALGKYGFAHGQGLYTNMNAIRRDEETDNLHSLYVDQWDWERVISREERNLDYLKETVRAIYDAMKAAEDFCAKAYNIEPLLPSEISFATTQELEDAYPTLTSHQRELAYAKEHGAVFLMQIGDALRSGMPHDGRSADYDDWQLNGDIIFYYPVLDEAFEISSMGIRVDEASLQRQLEIRGQSDKLKLAFQNAVLHNKLPLSIGGGIGQSRLCMFMLRKAHIGEVQCSTWTEETERMLEDAGIPLL